MGLALTPAWDERRRGLTARVGSAPSVGLRKEVSMDKTPPGSKAASPEASERLQAAPSVQRIRPAPAGRRSDTLRHPKGGMTWASATCPRPPTRFLTRLIRTRLSVMPTDLFMAVAGLSALHVEGAVPPSCRHRVDAGRLAIDADAALLEGPTWRPRQGARHLVPSLSLLGAGPCGFRFEVSALTGGAWTPWVATATIGPAVFAGAQAATTALVSEIDMYTAPLPIERVRLRARVHPAQAITSCWMMGLSASDVAVSPTDTSGDVAVYPTDTSGGISR